MMRAIAAVTALACLGGCAFVPFRHHHAAPRSERPAAVAAAAPSAQQVLPATTAGELAAVGPCRLDLLKVLEGRPGSAVLAAQALDLSGARSLRWLHPGDIVTMDFRPDRLNIKLTRANVVKSFACG